MDSRGVRRHQSGEGDGVTGATDRSGQVISVLILDDDELFGSLLARCCDSSDMVVTAVVTTAKEAVESAMDSRPDVVLMDWHLVGGSSASAARVVQQLLPQTKVLVVTADPSPEVEAEAILAGCWGCIGKTMLLGERLPSLIRQAHLSGEDPVE